MSRADQKPHKFEHLYADFWNCLETELDLNQLCELLQKRKEVVRPVLKEMEVHGFVAVSTRKGNNCTLLQQAQMET